MHCYSLRGTLQYLVFDNSYGMQGLWYFTVYLWILPLFKVFLQAVQNTEGVSDGVFKEWLHLGDVSWLLKFQGERLKAFLNEYAKLKLTFYANRGLLERGDD